MARRWCWLAAAACMAVTSEAWAYDKKDDFSLDDPEKSAAPEDSPPPPAPEEESGLLSDEQAMQEERAPTEQFRESTDPHEDPEKTYFFVGAGWRYALMPSGVLELFMESAPAVRTPGGISAEFAYRKDGFQVAANLGYMKYDFTGPFQLSGDPDEDTEWLETDWNLLLLTASITWSTAFTDWLALEYGLEAGVAFIFGDMKRTEAYRDASGNYAKCEGPGVPAIGTFCDQPIPENGVVPQNTNSADADGAHYGVTAVRGIANGGVPYAVPVIGPKVSLRIKPIAQLVLRLDVPLPVLPLGFVGGLYAQYGF